MHKLLNSLLAIVLFSVMSIANAAEIRTVQPISKGGTSATTAQEAAKNLRLSYIGSCGLYANNYITGESLYNRINVNVENQYETYTPAASDCGGSVILKVASGNSVGLPDPGALWPGYYLYVLNLSSTAHTITVSGSILLNYSSSAISLATGQGGIIYTDGANWYFDGVTNSSLSDTAVTSKLLTGYTSGAGTVAATDTILQAIQKLNGNVAALTTGVSSVYGRTGAVTAQSGDYTTDQVTEGSNLYYTNARGIASTLTGFSSGSGSVSSSDTILQATQKLDGNIALKANLTANTYTGTQSVTPTTISRSSSTYTPTFASSNTFQLVLDHATCTSGSPCTIANPSGTIVPGTDLVIEVKQSSTGGDYATYGSYYKFPSSISPTLSTAANATDIINCHVSDATHLFCGVIGNFAQ